MGWKRFAAGVGAGVAVTLIAKNQMEKNQSQLSPEKALKQVKEKAKHLGSIEGSWVHMIPEKYETDELSYNVYRGGITCTDEQGKMNAYEFYADSSTGAILKLVKQDD
ncbi:MULTISPECIES: PepSY domain-containing protein [Evansella]|jgi:predicted small secreted protein|uniref:PepSY domain-containing protein n=1 Tax=Evansella TaxID=2837485 RepID=UPI000996C7E5|nr:MULTISPECIES: PepSY domain-containing protein [Evansella]UTR11433.1 PepSY domain-containing protein [Evansella sp. LMS18]